MLLISRHYHGIHLVCRAASGEQWRPLSVRYATMRRLVLRFVLHVYHQPGAVTNERCHISIIRTRSVRYNKEGFRFLCANCNRWVAGKVGVVGTWHAALRCLVSCLYVLDKLKRLHCTRTVCSFCWQLILSALSDTDVIVAKYYYATLYTKETSVRRAKEKSLISLLIRQCLLQIY